MRWNWLFAVAITALGCKDKEAPKPVEQRPAAPAGSGAPPAPVAPPAGPAAPAAPAMPRLDPAAASAEFTSETEDKEWAPKTEAAIKAAVPELTDVDCRQHQCRATLHATNENDLVSRADKLSNEDSLRGTGARTVLLTAPVTTNGKLSMKIYVRYDR